MIFIFIISFIFLIYIHFLYALLLYVCGYFKSKKTRHAYNDTNITEYPFVTIIIAAYNEEKSIKDKISNTLNINYPRDKLEIIVFSDASTDSTDKIVTDFADKGIILLRFEGRIGKTSCQNLAAEQSNGDIIIYTDATSMLAADSLKELLKPFSITGVGCVVGKLMTPTEQSKNGSIIEAKYFLNFTQWLKKLENNATMPVGGSGALFAIRSELAVNLPQHANDDLLRPLSVALQGQRIVYADSAIATESINQTYREIFRQKTRIAERSVYSLKLCKQLLNPFRYGLFSLQVLTKLLLRRLVFPALVFFLLSGLWLLFSQPNCIVAILALPWLTIIVFAGTYAMLVRFSDRSDHSTIKIARACYYYMGSVIASFIGIIRGISGSKTVSWEPSRTNHH